jgi:hypothetical protein
MVLPAILRAAETRMFRPARAPRAATCDCAYCAVISAATVIVIALNVRQYWDLSWGLLGWTGIIAVPLLIVLCRLISRRQTCRTATPPETDSAGSDGRSKRLAAGSLT